MKIRYLPEQDRQAIRRLRNTSDSDEMAAILNSALHRSFTMQALWEYRKWFEQLEPKHFEKYPMLYIGYSHILVMGGKLQEARRLLDSAPSGEVLILFARLLLPGNSKEEWRDIVAQIKESGVTPGPNLAITVGRPSVLNGAWDMTPYSRLLETNRETVIKGLEAFYGEQAPLIYEVALAESLYYQDKCYDALVSVVALIPSLKAKQDMRLLFVALALEIFIMVTKNQLSSTASMMNNLREQMSSAGLEEYLPNIDAFDAWAAMYDGDYARVVKWMREGAPDEYGKFCMLDTFRYMVKMRAYIILGKYLSVTALAQRLMPLLEAGKRYMDCCELHLIWAMSDHADGRTKEALEHLKAALELSERYGYDRLIADEGKRVYELLKLYRNDNTKSPYLAWITELTEITASQFPRYLKTQLPEKPEMTAKELRVLRLLAENYSNMQIAQELDIAFDTVKTHCRNIFGKLQVRNRSQAVQRAVEFGIIKPQAQGAIPVIRDNRKRGSPLGTVFQNSTNEDLLI